MITWLSRRLIFAIALIAMRIDAVSSRKHVHGVVRRQHDAIPERKRSESA
jgi:hypothetical protein